ncbi:MAG: hypothetical protein AAB569_04705 [Patescibacteria group bacterium]
MIDLLLFICLNYKTMITDADIKKMKAVFATKEDLKAMDKRIDSLSNSQRQNTEDLIELITSGFDRTEKAIRMISDHDEIIENHERRLDKIEDKIFA